MQYKKCFFLITSWSEVGQTNARLQSFIPDRSLISDAVGTPVVTPPAQSQSTVGQSNES